MISINMLRDSVVDKQICRWRLSNKMERNLHLTEVDAGFKKLVLRQSRIRAFFFSLPDERLPESSYMAFNLEERTFPISFGLWFCFQLSLLCSKLHEHFDQKAFHRKLIQNVQNRSNEN